MTYDHYGYYRRPQNDAERAEELADLRRRANENLVMNRARRANLINHKAGM